MTDEIVNLSSEFDVETDIDLVPVRHLVLVLHGIYSISDRWSKLERVFEAGFGSLTLSAYPVSYRMMGILSLFSRNRAQERAKLVTNRIERVLAENEYDFVSLHCHSNGTKVFTDLLDSTQRKFDWVFFAGSIGHTDDDQKFAGCKTIINDCGVNDIFPILACAIRPNTFGHTGVVGFQNSPVTDRFFPFGHSGATKTRHFEQAIIPVLKTGDARAKLPDELRQLSHAPWTRLIAPKAVRIIALSLVVAAIAYAWHTS